MTGMTKSIRTRFRRKERQVNRRSRNAQRPSRRKQADRASSSTKVLIGARVSESFHRRIQTERVRREMSTQELMVAALKVYFRMPVAFDRAEIRFYTDDPNYTQQQADERNAWTTLWDRYTSQMPREKILVMISAMEWDLTMQKSSRRKRRAPGLKAEKEEASEEKAKG